MSTEFTWLLDDLVNKDKVHALHAYLTEIGKKSIIVSREEVLYPDLDIPDDSLAILYGALSFCSNYYRKTNYNPGLLNPFDKYKCSIYRPIIYKYLLNKSAIYTTLWEFLHGSMRGEIFDYLDNGSDAIFIRPDDGLKSFSGGVCQYSIEKWKQDNLLALQSCEPNLSILISPAYGIEEEYRCFYANGEYITGSRYRKGGELNLNPGVPSQIIDWLTKPANKLLKAGYKGVMIDVAISGGCKYIVEINSPNASGLYDMDIPCFVEGMEKASSNSLEKI